MRGCGGPDVSDITENHALISLNVYGSIDEVVWLKHGTAWDYAEFCRGMYTVLCKSLEPPFISLYFLKKM